MSGTSKDLERWSIDGTAQRVLDAMKSRTPVLIRRSSGAEQLAVIASCGGFGGLLCIVAWHDDGPEKARFSHTCDNVLPGDDTYLKSVHTADIIELNPWLRGVQS